MDKTFLVEQLRAKLSSLAESTARVADDARIDAKSGANRAVNLAKGITQRFQEALVDADLLNSFTVRPLGRGELIGVGAVVELENEDGGRTVFIAPAGAGQELTGPGGDGFFQVVTPLSPMGRALMGKRVGDTIDFTVQGEVSEWTIVYAA